MTEINGNAATLTAAMITMASAVQVIHAIAGINRAFMALTVISTVMAS